LAVQAGLTAFQANAFQIDAFQILDDDLSDGGGDYGAPRARQKHKRKSKKERERLLDQALAKAFEPKRGPKRPLPEPWLAEPVTVPEILPVPEFNPAVADLSSYVTQLQQQLAQRKFELSQMEADDELLLLSL
jgi:hypothetical protein